MTSQYGLFPHFLAPIFAVVGVSVLKFTIVIAVLVAAVLAVLWAFLRGATQNRMVAVLGLAAVIVNSSYPLIETNDLYFQYMPIRMVAPVASLWLTWRYLVRPSRGRYWATMFALGAGPLWNLDSGLPALASWLGVLAYGELGTVGTRTRTKLSRIAGHLGAGGLGMSTAVLAYSVLALARSGHRPDFAAFLEFQRTFYVTGFYMLPMPATGGWWAVALVYLAGLAYAARALATDRVTPRSAILFHLATLGIGLFSYYQGRSHPRVLSLVWWPAVVILTLFLDDLIADWGKATSRISRVAAAAVLTWVIGGSAWSLSEQGPFLKNWYENHLLATRNKGQSVIAPDIAMLRRSLARGERTLVIFEHESHLSNRLHRRSFWRSSLIESLLVNDFRAMRRRIERGEFDRILVSRNSVNESNTRHRGLILMGDIFRNAAVVDQSPNSVLLRPKIAGM